MNLPVWMLCHHANKCLCKKLQPVTSFLLFILSFVVAILFTGALSVGGVIAVFKMGGLWK
jgi:hypothetical protein